jgi:hypothetical protein
LSYITIINDCHNYGSLNIILISIHWYAIDFDLLWIWCTNTIWCIRKTMFELCICIISLAVGNSFQNFWEKNQNNKGRGNNVIFIFIHPKQAQSSLICLAFWLTIFKYNLIHKICNLVWKSKVKIVNGISNWK